MLSEFQPDPRPRSWVGVSLTLHVLVLGWLVHSPRPIFVAPHYLARGVQGGAISYLYWPSNPAGHEIGSTNRPDSTSRQQMSAKARLTWRRARELPRAKRPELPLSNTGEDARNSPSPPAQPAPPAGSPYGSLWNGPLTGAEIRPALPVRSPDPAVDPSELPNGVEGSVVIEVTIDERGNIVRKVVLQSLGPAIDNKVLAALENWHFLPATRYGVPIPSKQDVSYHFKPRV